MVVTLILWTSSHMNYLSLMSVTRILMNYLWLKARDRKQKWYTCHVKRLKKTRETKSCLAFISLHRFALAQTWESSSRNLYNEERYHSCSEGHWAIANLSSFLSLQKTKLCGTLESRILMRLLHLNFFFLLSISNLCNMLWSIERSI